MKAGDVCRCISDFSGISAEELTLYKNDIVQIHEVVDKHWLRGEGGGSVGLVPSSVLVKVELPPHPSHLPLFVASAEFFPSQPGDLGLARGNFVIGLNPIDESWWCGETWGKQGMFPLNFVWRLNKDIIEVEDTSEQVVRLQARVRSSIKAQLPEELDLYAGDLVNITHIVDKDWYRGESNGATGIFPKSFVELVDESSVPSLPSDLSEENNFMVSDTPSSSSQTGGTLSNSMSSAAPYSSGTPAQPLTQHIGYSAPITHSSMTPSIQDATFSPVSTSQSPSGSTEPTNIFSKTSTAWKTIDEDDGDLFDDDYFKQNMPGLYSSKGGGSTASAYIDDTIPSALSEASGASESLTTTGSRYENIPVSVPQEEVNSSVPTIPYAAERNSDQYRYENIPIEEPQSLIEDTEHSALLGQQNGITKIDSLSQKVEDYFSNGLLGQCDSNALTRSNAVHNWAYRGPSYTEDNTGIEPYGRAVFSFKAQYPNELTFKKGEIVHLLQHVDSHWTLGRAGDTEGIFPTSYVDIIVDCPHSEEEHFLARPEPVLSTTHPIQAMAQYDFKAEQAGDVSMKKGDILTVLKEVDNNWVVVENTTGSKGMCPKNYLFFLKETKSAKVMESQNKISDFTSDTCGEEPSRLEESSHQRSRSSSPLSASWKRRSYNKDDFGVIKKQDVEQVLAKNMACFDFTSKTSVSRSEKGSNSVFTEREVSSGEERQLETTKKPKPIVLPRQSKMSPIVTSGGVPEPDNKPTHTQETLDTIPMTTPTTTTTTTTTTLSTASSSTTSTVASITTTSTSTTSTLTTASTITTSITPSITTTTTTTTTILTTASTTTTSTKPSITFTTTTTSTTSTTPSITTPTTTTRTGSFTATRPAPPPLIPKRTKILSRNDSIVSDSQGATEVKSPSTPSQLSSHSQPQPLSQTQAHSQADSKAVTHPQSSSQSQSQSQPPSEPIYSQVKKNAKKSQEVKIESGVGSQRMNDSANGSANFPDDVCHLSLASEATYSSESNLSNTSSGFVPQRPAPPPPPKLPDTQEAEEHYYSSTSQEPEGAKYQVVEAVELVIGEDDEDDVEEVEKHVDHESEGTTPDPQKSSMRRVVVEEIVTTEHEYIHDLEALLQVVQLAPSRPDGTQGVHLPTLLGNITQVIDVAKKFASLLDQSAYGKEEEVCVGRVFLACAEELCQTYKVYCANHNITVEPFMQKYEQEADSSAFLQWVLEELQQHKIQLLDMRSVLIKPLQRVLKYPLFLDRLVRDTPEHHPDHQDLLEAKTAMANVAKEINDYTKRLDLVNKYRVESDQSLQSKMQRVSLHSVAKKSARLSTLVSEMLGIMVQTKDLEFDEEVAKFKAMQRWAAVMAQDMEALLQGVKARHKGELGVVRGLIETVLQPSPEVKALHTVAMDSAGRLFETFDNFVRQRVVLPTKKLVVLCEVPDRLILKRSDKLLDYDNAQYKLDRNRDPTRTRILEEELSQAQGTYSALNTQLMMDLPVLTRSGIEVLTLATRSFISARMYLQGHLARLYLNLSQALGLTVIGEEEDMLTQFRVKYLQQVGEFRQLSFIPPDSQHWSIPRAKSRSRKSLENVIPKREHAEAAKMKVLGQYPGELVYVVREVHTPGEVMELTLYPGDHVALLKNKDPLGRTDRWFVDDGDNKGFVRASCLKPLLEGRGGGSAAALPQAASGTAAPPSRPAAPAVAPQPCTVPRPAPAPPEQAPPRYEDIFPGVPTILPQGPGHPQAPPPRYSNEGTPTPTPQQPSLPSKPEPVSPSGGGEGGYYSPPLDRQSSGEYTSPVTEENNIYEEIDQGHEADRGENGAVGETDTSPIYEIIKDGEIVKEEDTTPESNEPQFHYALYNFGGSDGTQLNLVAGQVVLVLHAVSSDWWFVEERSGKQGYVPASYLTRYN